jgi:hypothetical protein
MPTALRPNPSGPNGPHPVRSRRESGVGLIGLLISLALIGALAATIPLLADRTSGLASTPGLTTPAAGQPAGGSAGVAGGDVAAAEAAACETNFQAAEAAVSFYEAQTGSPPTATAEVQALLRDPLSSAFFTITIDPTKPGHLEVATRGHPAADGDSNCTAAAA